MLRIFHYYATWQDNDIFSQLSIVARSVILRHNDINSKISLTLICVWKSLSWKNKKRTFLYHFNFRRRLELELSILNRFLPLENWAWLDNRGNFQVTSKPTPTPTNWSVKETFFRRVKSSNIKVILETKACSKRQLSNPKCFRIPCIPQY